METEIYKAYCFGCKDHCEITSPIRVTLKNGRPAVKGTCKKCGRTVFRMLSTKK